MCLKAFNGECAPAVVSARLARKPPQWLTHGARALAKHCHRDQTESFWGQAQGPVPGQNAHALQVLGAILTNLAWKNVHALPHDLHIFEVRNAQGYGARWTADGQVGGGPGRRGEGGVFSFEEFSSFMCRVLSTALSRVPRAADGGRP